MASEAKKEEGYEMSMKSDSKNNKADMTQRETTARINFEAPKSLKIKFKAACVANDTDMTEEFIKFMREYVK